MPFGYHGCYLRIDVSPLDFAGSLPSKGGSVERVRWPIRSCASSLAAVAWVCGCCSTKAARTSIALDPRAPLIFAFSPLVGSPLTTSAKFAVVSKSPLTDRINDSLASSGFAIAGKSCGCDAIVIVGRAPELSVLIIDDGRVRVESAAEYAGQTCRETEAGLRARLGANFRIAAIGPAGEHCCSLRHHLARWPPCRPRRQRSSARRQEHQGDRRPRNSARRVGAPATSLTAISKDLSKRSFGPATAKYRELGTATNLLTFNRLGALPTRNFQSGTFEGAAASPRQLDDHALEDARELRRVHDRLRAYLLPIGDERGPRRV